MISKESAYSKISELVDRFSEQYESYRQSEYNEALTRIIHNEELQTVKLETKAQQIKSRIDYCEEEINKAVYKLYDLTEEEIKIVEGK